VLGEEGLAATQARGIPKLLAFSSAKPGHPAENFVDPVHALR
jgi:hypothetical protein